MQHTKHAKDNFDSQILIEDNPLQVPISQILCPGFEPTPISHLLVYNHIS